MSRALTIFVILSALATGAAIVLGLLAEDLAWSQFWPDFTRAIAVVSWVVGALVWCTERICRAVESLRTTVREEIDTLRTKSGKHHKHSMKHMRTLETLGRERIEAARQVQGLFDPRRRANER